MTNDPVYWAANVAGLDDANLLRFLEAVEQRRAKYQVALDAATKEAKRRRLIVDIKKDGAETPPSRREEGNK